MVRVSFSCIVAALALAACSSQGVTVTDDSEALQTDESLCGPEEVGDKFGTIPTTNAWGITGNGLVIYPMFPDVRTRAYGLTAEQNDIAMMGAAMADFWNPSGRVFRVVNAADATVQITATNPPKTWTGCGDIPVHDCWFGGTSCQASEGATGVPEIRLCKSWRINLNFPSMQLFADANGLPIETVALVTAAHEMGHAMGLRHRNTPTTIMHTGLPVPGWTPGVTWETLPRFDACQRAALAQFYVDPDDLSFISFGTPNECL